MRTKLIACVRACAVVLPLAGCASTSDGLEFPQAGFKRPLVVFDWRGEDVSGTMTAGLRDGRQFRGVYLRVTRELPAESLNALWDGWSGQKLEWSHWNPDSASGFLEHYEGKVVANLGAGADEHMRCRFRLARPWAGMRGGGDGLCQLTDGTTIDATFPPAPAKTRTGAEPQSYVRGG